MSQYLLLLGGGGLIAVALVVLVLALATGNATSSGVARSLELVDASRRRSDVAKQELPFSERLVVPLLGATRALGARLSPAGTGTRLQRGLEFAGNPASWTVERILGVKGALLLGFALVGGLLGGLGLRGLALAAALGAAGFWLPDLLVYNAGLRRQTLIKRTLPDALDMLTVCVEAGLGFDGALLQVARNIEGPLAGEFARVLQEVQIGKPRGEALSALTSRTKVDSLNTFVSALGQAERLGIPIADVLREQSREMRLIRRQTAEEQAQKVPVKIVFPLLLCIFPALFVVVIGPGVIGIVGAFSGRF